jgi:hypothetical protein
MSSPIVTTASPGPMASSATSVATLGSFTNAYGGPGAPTLVLEADINVTATSGTPTVFMRITETVSSTVIATSQISLPSGGQASMRCIGTFLIPTGPQTVAFLLEAWATPGAASIGVGSGVFCLRGGL